MNIDQRGINNQYAELLTGAEACRLLGIKRQTLYAYVSRGLLQSEPKGGPTREHLYRREDIERLKARHDARSGHGAVAASALRWGEPVLESAITSVSNGELRYRGKSAVELARAGKSIESVADLLWQCEGQDDKTSASKNARDKHKNTEELRGLRAGDLAFLLPPKIPALSVLPLVAAVLGARDPDRYLAPDHSEIPRARALIHCLAAALGLGHNPHLMPIALRQKSIAETVLAGIGARITKSSIALVNAALVLCADHELNASTFAVRVTASTGADLYACVGTGLAAVSGPKHGGACDRIEALVMESARPENALSVIQARARRGETIQGFGHPFYPKGDPRGAPLIEMVSPRAPKPGDTKNIRLRTLLALVSAMYARSMETPSIDTGLVAVAFALGAPPGTASGLFAIGRSVGWIAHVFEQRKADFLMRPRARYVGP